MKENLMVTKLIISELDGNDKLSTMYIAIK